MQTPDADPLGNDDLKLAYVILRITLGINMSMHGAVRIMAGLGGFAEGMVKQFAETPLPAVFVRAFGHTVPLFEVTIGLLILLGIQTRWALAAGGLFMASLVFGTSLRSDWTMVMLQMIYAVIFYLLLARRRDDAFTLGTMIGGRPKGER
jgi:thiosulfate dehydrogenase [quinone] large subunit